VAGVVHCFTGNAQEAQEALDLGLYIGITGWICDERPERGAAELAALLPLIPDDRLLIETDAPYLTPRSITPSKKRPSRNEPALLQIVLRAVAEARGQSMEEVAKYTTENATRLFGI
jgi:TatD DNase family protein